MRNKEYKKLKQERLYKKANRHHKTTTRDDRSPSRPQPKTEDGGKKHGPLTSYINSSYISAMNRLGGRNARQRIVAYVESYDDVFFGAICCDRSKQTNIILRLCCPRAPRSAKAKNSTCQ